MALKKSQIYSTLWESCNALRGSMDASQYKDYVLIILFVKYLSDKAKRKEIKIKIPEGCYFEDFIALKQNSSIGEKINIKLEAIKEANPKRIGDLKLPDFNDPKNLGSGKDMVDTLSKLIACFDKDELDFSKNRAADDDLLGDAYEYLMKNFAAESGKSKGQFYTPAEVSRVIAKVLNLEELELAGNTIYDPTCGSGSLLLRAMCETASGKCSLFGQEKDSTTAALAKLNLLLHGIDNAQIRVGDTLKSPHTEGGMLPTFDICIANPPFSQKGWMKLGGEKDPYNRWGFNLSGKEDDDSSGKKDKNKKSSVKVLPPENNGDYAFLLHLIASMKPEIGRGACILPLGVLFRGNSEADVRKYLVDRHYIKGIIGLPGNLFFGTGIPACIIIIDKKDAGNRKGIFFIQAKDGFIKDGAKNRLREQDIKLIVDTWKAQRDVEHYARFVEWDEITDKNGNNYNLNLSRYIDSVDTTIHQDIYAHLHGGIPKYDVDSFGTLWSLCPNLKGKLFNVIDDNYYSLIPDSKDIQKVISGDETFKKQSNEYQKTIDKWLNSKKQEMLSLQQKCIPKQLIEVWSQDLLDTFRKCNSLVNAYEVYDQLMNYWLSTMQDDCYMVSADGWKVVLQVPTTKKKDKQTGEEKIVAKKTYSYDELSCDLLPVKIVVEKYFSEELSVINGLKEDIEEQKNKLENLVEENTEDFDDGQFANGGATLANIKTRLAQAKINPELEGEKEILEKCIEYINNKQKLRVDELKKSNPEIFANFSKVTLAALKKRIDEMSNYKYALPDSIEKWEEYVSISSLITTYKKQLSANDSKMKTLVMRKYSEITEDEVKKLVVEKKWFTMISYCLSTIMTQQLFTVVENINGIYLRYYHLLSEIEANVSVYEDKLKKNLKKMGFTF